MITVSDAFWKFRGRLETTDTEDATVGWRQQKLRGQLDEAVDIVAGFLTGAYRRHTKTKPLRDVDSAADRIADGWPDPARVGPDVSDVLDTDPAKMRNAPAALRDAEAACTKAILLDRQGDTKLFKLPWNTALAGRQPAPEDVAAGRPSPVALPGRRERLVHAVNREVRGEGIGLA